MRVSTSQTMILLIIILSHLLNIFCVAIAFRIRRCATSVSINGDILYSPCYLPRLPDSISCYFHDRLCRIHPSLSDCRLPRFQCVRNSRCIPRTRVCNGILDCSDGSDEWGCDTSTTEAATINMMISDNEENIGLDFTNSSMIPQENEEKTTNVILPASETSTSSSTKSTIDARFDSNGSLSSTSSTMTANSESSSGFSFLKTTGTILSGPEDNTSPLPLPTSKILPYPKSSGELPSTLISDSEWGTALPLSTTRAIFSGSESNTAFSSTTTQTKISAFSGVNTILPESEGKTSSSPKTTILPEFRMMQSCPDNYCMHNAMCVIVQGKFRCKCPSSFIGELCEIQLGRESGSYEYLLVLLISSILAMLCLAVVLVCIYRQKRLSAWKSKDLTSRTLSQLTLTANVV